MNPEPMPFDKQLYRVLDTFGREEASLFLAGVRFVQGFKEYGDSLFTMDNHELALAELEEAADQIVYQAEINARQKDLLDDVCM